MQVLPGESEGWLSSIARVLRAVGTRRHDGSPVRVLAAARTVMRSKRFCLLVTDSTEGSDARVVQPFRPNADLVVHVGTSAHSRKLQQIQRSGRALLAYERDRDGACVVAHCSAEVLEDMATRRRYFMPLWHAFWPAGPEDDFVVIRCVPDRLEVWDARRGITPPPFGLTSAQLVRTPEGWREVA